MWRSRSPAWYRRPLQHLSVSVILFILHSRGIKSKKTEIEYRMMFLWNDFCARFLLLTLLTFYCNKSWKIVVTLAMILRSNTLQHPVIFITWTATYPCGSFMSLNVFARFYTPNHFIMVALSINSYDDTNFERFLLDA